MPASWIFDGLPASRARRGGNVSDQVFDSNIDTFVREVLQNSLDQGRRVKGDAPLDVSVRFKLRRLSSDAKDQLLDGIGWDQLENHLEGSRKGGGTTIAPRLAEGLDLLEQDSLRVMIVEDRGTNGLTGDEDGDSNFANLCRHELVTSADRKESGGSFGIGKSVLWRFSLLSTVFFYSRPLDASRGRFIGRTHLPSHDSFGETWAGPGWFGDTDRDGSRAVSMWGRLADDLAAICDIGRSEGDFGTSILILAFDDPAHDDEPSVVETCSSIRDSASRWFWPSLRTDSLSIDVEGFENHRQVFGEAASAEVPEVEGFSSLVEAESVDASIPEDLTQVMERSIPVAVPARNDGQTPAYDAVARLRLRLIDDDEASSKRGVVALQRGTGMVVEYRRPDLGRGSTSNFQAVLLAGTASGSSPSDHALEQFLRAAEPPAHNSWKSVTDRLKDEYHRKGRQEAILAMFRHIDAIVGELSGEVETIPDEIPGFLKKMLPFRGAGKREPKPAAHLKDTHAYLVEGAWQFEGLFTKRGSVAEPWECEVLLEVDQEGPGRKTGIPIRELTAPGCSVTLNETGAAVVQVLPGIAEVLFKGISEVMPALDMSRLQLKMSVRTKN